MKVEALLGNLMIAAKEDDENLICNHLGSKYKLTQIHLFQPLFKLGNTGKHAIANNKKKQNSKANLESLSSPNLMQIQPGCLGLTQ